MPEALQIKSPQREAKGDNKESGRRGCTDQGHAEGGEGQQIKTAYAEARQIKGPKREDKGDNKDSRRRCSTDQEPAEGGEWRQIKTSYA